MDLLLSPIKKQQFFDTPYCLFFRRPLALKASDIGAWYFLLEFIGILAVVTNVSCVGAISNGK